LVAVPQAAAALTIAPAAGIVEGTSGRRARVEAFRSRAEIDSTLLIAGCDPAVAVMADWLTRHHAPVSVCAISCSSRAAMTAVSRGEVHVAGVHLRDPKSGDYNLEAVRRALGRRRVMLVNFVLWELGLAVAAGNPRGIRGFEDLARSGVRLVNRELGSGARFALDEAFAALRIDARRITGYDRELPGHLEVAGAVAAREADAGVTIRVAADAYGVGFIALREERYDLVIPEREADHAAVRAMLDALNSRRFARELSELCSYDTNQTGRVLARLS
ncbi:MAG: substrate-binding domain-containing protein, partial [Candidatus Binataceae bacterium]